MRRLLPTSLQRLLLLNEVALLVLVVLAGSLAGLWAYFWQQSSSEALRITSLLETATRIRGDTYSQLQEVTRARLTEALDTLTDYTSVRAEVDLAFDRLDTLAADAEERVAIDFLRKTYGVVALDMDKIFTDPTEISEAARMRLLDPAFEEWMMGEFESALTVLSRVLTARQRRLQASIERWTGMAPFMLPLPVLAAIVLLVVVRRSVATGFVAPVGHLFEGARRWSTGELDHRVPEVGAAEMRDLARSVNRMAADLAASQTALVQSERQATLGALVPVVAHNIRNPLASIRATAQLVDADSDDAELAEARAAIIESVDRLERWVSALLSYLNPLEPNRRPARLSEVAAAALGLLDQKCEGRSLTVESRTPEDEPTLDVDVDLLEQAVFGLINNAVEAAPAGTTIRITVAADAEAVSLDVDDDGAGIAFDPKPQGLGPGPSTKPWGTGLGIPFAFKVVAAHGGHIEVKRRSPQGGTRASIRLPRST